MRVEARFVGGAAELSRLEGLVGDDPQSSAACGARPIDELVVERAGMRLECHNLDHGPGGLPAFQHAALYRELGLPLTGG